LTLSTTELRQHLDALDRAIASGVTRVRAPDGSFTAYASFAEMQARREWLFARLAETEGSTSRATRHAVVSTRKALR